MFYAHYLLLATSILASPISAQYDRCKTTPSSHNWPCPNEWRALNDSLDGRLLHPSPPGGVCHPDQPTYNATECSIVQALWPNTTFHANNPVSVNLNNWNNDSCLPWPEYPCSGNGYPIYVVNATTAEDVSIGVDFARKHDIRLVVKSTGHDFLGRSNAPNSLSIWTRNFQGFQYQATFKPEGCNDVINSHSITIGGGMEMGEIYQMAAAHGMDVVGGGGQTVSIGGYMTGGGHGGLSSSYGMAADQALEVEIVTASGEIVKANECQNSDLFWAVRGGGGSTFGILTSVTFIVYPQKPISQYGITVGSSANNEDWWDAMAYLLGQLPRLSDTGMMAYIYFLPNSSVCGLPVNCSLVYGAFLMPDPTAGAPDALFAPITAKIKSTWPSTIFFSANETQYPTFYDWWSSHRDQGTYGTDILVGSRLLDGPSLTKPAAEVKTMLKGAMGNGGVASTVMAAGKNVWNAKPRGGGNAVNPAWRKAYLHFIVSVDWAPLDQAAKEQQTKELDRLVEPLREFNRDSGAYINEANPYEPNWQQAFWGSNYPRLWKIKKRYDPDDVFWCFPCVGSEGWTQVGRDLCKEQRYSGLLV